MEVDDDNIIIDPEIRSEIVRDEEEMKNIVYTANELFYDPVRYLPEEVQAVEQLVNRIEKPIPDTSLDGMYNLFIYSTLLFFISEGFDVLPVDGRTIYPKNEVPYDWRNAIAWYYRYQDTDTRIIDPSYKFTPFRLMMRDRLYSVRILLHDVPRREVEIYLSPYSYFHQEHITVHETDTDPCVILKTEIARFFVMSNRWLHFGFYLRYNVKKVLSARIRKAQGQPVRSAPRMFGYQNEGSLRTTPDSSEREFRI